MKKLLLFISLFACFFLNAEFKAPQLGSDFNSIKFYEQDLCEIIDFFKNLKEYSTDFEKITIIRRETNYEIEFSVSQQKLTK